MSFPQNGAENKEVSHRDVVKGSLTVQSISWCPNGDGMSALSYYIVLMLIEN